MKVHEPTSRFLEIAGAFELDRAAIERIVRAMERHIPETEPGFDGKVRPRKVLFSLEFRDNRKAESADLADLDHFAFHSKDRSKFEIRVDGSKGSVTCEFSYRYFQQKVRVHAFRTANVDAAAKDISDAVISARTWYSALFEHSISDWGNPIVWIGAAVGVGDSYVLGRDVVPVWPSLVFAMVLYAIVAAKAWLFDRLVIPFGAEAQRMEVRRRIRRWFPLTIGALILAVIGGGYLARR